MRPNCFPCLTKIRSADAPRVRRDALPSTGERLKSGRSGEISASRYGLPIPLLWPG